LLESEIHQTDFLHSVHEYRLKSHEWLEHVCVRSSLRMDHAVDASRASFRAETKCLHQRSLWIDGRGCAVVVERLQLLVLGFHGMHHHSGIEGSLLKRPEHESRDDAEVVGPSPECLE
jgi:hypothetical protein